MDLLPPCDIDQVAIVIKSLGQYLSRDVKELYALTAGMEDGVMDELCFSLWPLLMQHLAYDQGSNPFR